ncbi:hypothetical protein CVS40_10429 [Lucilia cuprina]|nr:hypothetical protein CVS40_10429 [Lucilia cuprina]
MYLKAKKKKRIMAALPLTLDTKGVNETLNLTNPLMPSHLNDSSSSINAAATSGNDIMATPERPSNLIIEKTPPAPAIQQQQHSITTPSNLSSPALSLAGSLSPSPSTSFLPEMPQWKRDLIQRRKQNVQRTISASSPSPTALSSTSPTTLALAVGGLKNSISSSSVRSLAGSNTNIDQLASDGLPQVCSTKDYSTTTTTKVNKQYITTTATTNTTKPAINIKSFKTTSSPLKEKAEKLFGGQYTATSATTLTTTTTSSSSSSSNSTVLFATTKEEVNEEEIFSIKQTKEKSLVKNNEIMAEQQQQQQQEYFEIFKKTKEITNEEEQQQQEFNDETLITTTTTTTTTTASITNKQQQQQLQEMATRLTGSTNTNTASSSSPSTSSSATLIKRAENERENSGFSMNTTTGANVFAVTNSNHQSLNKCESERLVCAANNITGVTNINMKISQKLQENQFIKNEQQQQQQQHQQQQLNNKKFIKFKQNTVTGASFGEDLKSPSKLTSSNSAGSLAGAAAAATFLPSSSGNCLVKKKMVAVQEMKKSSQNNTHLSGCLATNRLNNRVGGGGGGGGGVSVESSELDTNEDLSYGPGIVSKLRCRYLSLALRESMEQQRLNKDQLRRSTSLNNLLDNHNEEENCDEDEEVGAEDDEDAAAQQDFIYENFKQDSPKKTGILKSSLNKTPEKRYSPHNQGSNGVGVTFTETSYNKRSRHLKRGNDSLKRARSVEALLSEKSPWHTRANTSAPCANQVSIEDKIHNARERLQQGTDHMPPKRLTSIIDDTERPPPDLVKQTLKMFEASANRRPRTTNRGNCKGEVASKVETFKNIIKEQKPLPTYNNKSLSPTKKLNLTPQQQQQQQQKPLKSSTPQANDLLQTPLGRKALNKAMAHNTSAESLTPLKGLNSLSEHTPDIIPRQKFNQEQREQNKNKEQMELQSKEKLTKRDLNKEKFDMLSDSPVTSLSKELSKLKLNDNTPTKSSNRSSDNCSKNAVNDGGDNGGGDASCQRHNINNKYPPYNNDLINEESNSLKNENDKIIINNKKSNNTEAITTTATTNSSSSCSSSNNTIAMKTEEATVNNYDCLTKKTDKEENGDNNVDDASTPPPSSSDLSDGGEDIDHDTGDLKLTTTKRITRTALDNIAKAGYTQQFKFNTTTTTNSPTSSTSSASSTALNTGKQIGVIRPLLNTQQQQQQQQQKINDSTMETLKHSSPNTTNLTSREIEKNRINDLKKSTNTTHQTSPTATAHNQTSSTSSPSASLEHHVIKSNASNSATASTTGYSDVDSVISATNSPLWAMRKRRQAPPAAPAENTSMVFNFSNRKEVPDYIENDGVIFRRKRELPKPNESGFVLLGDLSVETSTDMDYDDFSMCPPSPCDVEFVNANIVIDGKSSIRQKSKDTTFRVQFNDTLTSTFEYPSEASLIVDDSFSAYNESYTQPLGSSPTHDVNDFTHAFQNLCLENINSTIPPLTHQHHHHVADEIIQLPTLNASSSPATANNTNNTTATKNILGNLPLGSAPLGFYTPLKAPIDRLFQLGVTRAPSLLSNDSPTEPNAAASAANGRLFNGICDGDGSLMALGGNGSIVGISDGLITDDMIVKKSKTETDEEPESLQYIKPADDDDLNMAYSEGTQKTDLLY